ncbi:hypothetical protein MOE39_13460, partial [Bacillus cereus]|uniref:hypothetical protein n=1 Tax=Bacillus cereus TaxID=1396 RepID=UPI00227DB257|nr:hypothetical protein [Bacillus cereus]
FQKNFLLKKQPKRYSSKHYRCCFFIDHLDNTEKNVIVFGEKTFVIQWRAIFFKDARRGLNIIN